MPTFPFLVTAAAGPIRACARRAMQARSDAVKRFDRRNACYHPQPSVNPGKAWGRGKAGLPRRMDGCREPPGNNA